jgi:hypothetical protein
MDSDLDHYLAPPPTAPAKDPKSGIMASDSNRAVSILYQISKKSIEGMGEDRKVGTAATIVFSYDLLAGPNGIGGWTAVASFLGNPYWSRVWCLQEGSTPDAPAFKCPMIWYDSGRIQLHCGSEGLFAG